MISLSKENCEKLGKNTPALKVSEIKALLDLIPGWQITDQNGTPSISKNYQFNTYLDGLEFTHQIGQQAEKQDHHPAILTEWRNVTITWWTHAAGGLHRNDFIMAARTDAIYETYWRD